MSACQLSGKDDLSESACMEIDFLITLKMNAVTKHQEFVEGNAFLIPISHFSISSFLTFRVTPRRAGTVLRMRIFTCTSNLAGHLYVLLIGEVWELVWSEGKALRSERGGRMVTGGGGNTTPASGRKTSGAKTVGAGKVR